MATMSIQAQLEALQAQNAALQAKLAEANKPRKLTLKVSAKGAISLYGMGKFPVTLYTQQWDRVLDAADEIRAFQAANASLLATKD